MDSTKSLVRDWVILTLLIVGYAAVDLWMHPSLYQEMHFSMKPDITQIGDLWHWGGRLMKEGAVSLLIANAIIVGGLLALMLSGMKRALRRLVSSAEEASSEPVKCSPSMPPRA